MRVTAAMLEAAGWMKNETTGGAWMHHTIKAKRGRWFFKTHTFHEAARIYKEQQEKK